MKKRIVVFAGNECRKDREDYYFSLAYRIGKLLAKAGFVVVTGGGPGLMNQTTKGAFEAGGKTIGVCLKISGRKQSEYLTEKCEYHSLDPRREKLLSLGHGFIALPGGIGTFNEICQVLVLKRKMEISREIPLILIGSYFQEFKLLIDKLKSEGFIRKDFDSLFTIVASPEEALEKLKGSFLI